MPGIWWLDNVSKQWPICVPDVIVFLKVKVVQSVESWSVTRIYSDGQDIRIATPVVALRPVNSYDHRERHAPGNLCAIPTSPHPKPEKVTRGLVLYTWLKRHSLLFLTRTTLVMWLHSFSRLGNNWLFLKDQFDITDAWDRTDARCRLSCTLCHRLKRSERGGIQCFTPTIKRKNSRRKRRMEKEGGKRKEMVLDVKAGRCYRWQGVS